MKFLLPASVILLPLSISLSGCHSQPPTPSPAEFKAQFLQAVVDQDPFKVREMMDKPNAYSILQLQAPYHTPESDKDPQLKGETLEMWAIRTGRIKTAFVLMDSAPGVKNAFGRTPLMYTALYAPEVGPDQGYADTITQSRHLDFYAVDRNGDSALFLALRRGALDNSTRLLRLFPTDLIHIHNKRGQTALDVAKEGKNNTLVALITQAVQAQKQRRLHHSPQSQSPKSPR